MSLKAKLEAVIYASEEPVTLAKLASLFTAEALEWKAQEDAAAAAAHAAANNSGQSTLCANLGVYIFVGGTGGFDGLKHGDQFAELLQTGHVGLYEHATAVAAAEDTPSIIPAVESVFSGTGPGQAELGHVGANYFTLSPSYGYYPGCVRTTWSSSHGSQHRHAVGYLPSRTIATRPESLARVRGCGPNGRYRDGRSDRGPQ